MPRPSPWLVSPAMIAGTWLLSAQTPAPGAQVAALEKRVADLEALISKEGTVTRIKGPFMVMGPDGRAILEVANPSASIGSNATGAVVVTSDPGIGGVIGVRDKGGKFGVQITGFPAISAWNATGDRVVAMGATPEGKGRFVLEDKGTRLALLEDSAGAGTLSLLKKSDGQVVARLGVGSGGSGRLSVMNAEGKVGAAVMGNGLVGVAGKSGQTLAQLGVTPEGVGSVQIVSPNGVAMAVMSQGGNGNGGIFQILAGTEVKATLGTGSGGGGMLQLVSSSGTPTVEAGTMQSGRGIVRVGPFWKCSPIQASTPVMSMGHGDCLVGSLDAK